MIVHTEVSNFDAPAKVAKYLVAAINKNKVCGT